MLFLNCENMAFSKTFPYFLKFSDKTKVTQFVDFNHIYIKVSSLGAGNKPDKYAEPTKTAARLTVRRC